ncbi:MAG: DUF2461 domain-containing protein [Myxococcales bacterium]|nr:DUF2461 domain-containing protein [Myxococcales bacterium]MBK7198385.1 DUF2461 domain-containing protein [Myxococcales bacterium]MBP6849457.1 DUF2461 domain-containing protein [Kofleriaceae bacterium]
MARAAAPAPATPTFTGFAKDAMRFWPELAAEMSKPWFDANKARYQAQWVAPMTALLTTVAARLAPTYRPAKLGAPKVLRIYRDVRFSKDKTPYKTHLGAMIPAGDASLAEGGCAALYVHLGLDEEFVGVGLYQFGPEALARWRAAVAGKPGAALATRIAALRDAGYTVSGHDDYKKVPRGFAEDHPRAALLKQKGLTAMFPAIPRGLIHKPAFADWLAEHAIATAPLVTWLGAHVG